MFYYSKKEKAIIKPNFTSKINGCRRKSEKYTTSYIENYFTYLNFIWNFVFFCKAYVFKPSFFILGYKLMMLEFTQHWYICVWCCRSILSPHTNFQIKSSKSKLSNKIKCLAFILIAFCYRLILCALEHSKFIINQKKN